MIARVPPRITSPLEPIDTQYIQNLHFEKTIQTPLQANQLLRKHDTKNY